MAKLEAAMTKPGSTADWFAKQVGLTTVTEMAATYEEMVRSMVEDPAGALAAALAPKAKERTYLAVPNKEGLFSVFHGLTWWADAPGGVHNQQGHLVAFEGNIRSGCGVPNLWRFDEPDEQLFWLVELPPVALHDVARFYASDDNNDYYRDTIVPDKGRVGWKPMCGCLIPIPGEWAALFLNYPDLGTTFRRIMDLINLVDEAEWVKFQHLTQSVAYACFLASESARPTSTMASKWKRLIFTKPTLDWAQLAWSGQEKSAEATNGVATTTLAMSPANDFASIFGGLAWRPVRIPMTQTGHGERAPPGVDPVPTDPRVTYRATGAGPPGLDVETLIQTLFEAQVKARVVLAAGQNANLIAFHTATAQAMGSKSGEKDSKLTVAKMAILQACCGQADSTTFVAPTVYLNMEVEGGTSEAIGRILRKQLKAISSSPYKTNIYITPQLVATVKSLSFSSNGDKTHAGCTKGVTIFGTPWRLVEAMNKDMAEEAYFKQATLKSPADICKHVTSAKVELPASTWDWSGCSTIMSICWRSCLGTYVITLSMCGP
jgi:hypothetical protein